MPAVIRIGDPISCGDIMAEGSPNVFADGIPVSRVGVDHTAGHCYPPVTILSGSPDVFINSIAVARRLDPIPVHCCDDDCHSGVAIEGSPTTFANDGGAGVLQLMDSYGQPGISRLIVAEQHDDEPNSDVVYYEYRRYAQAEREIVPVTPILAVD